MHGGGDTIELEPGPPYELTCGAGGVLTHGDTPLVIHGHGSSLQMEAGCNDRVLVNGTGSLELDDLTLYVDTTFASSTPGALVSTGGALTLRGGGVVGVVSTTSGDLSVFSAASYTAIGVVLDGDKFTAAGTFLGVFPGDATLTDCVLRNTTLTSGDAIAGAVAAGDLMLSRCRVESLRVVAVGAVTGGLSGGNVTIVDSQFMGLGQEPAFSVTGNTVNGGVANADMTITRSQVGVGVTAVGGIEGGIARGDVTLADSAFGGDISAGGSISGGLVMGSLTTRGSEITAHVTSTGADIEGGVVRGALSSTNSTILTPYAQAAGQISGDVVAGDATLVNSTVMFPSSRAGVASTHGAFTSDTLTLTYATIVGSNTASGFLIDAHTLRSFGSLIMDLTQGFNCRPGNITVSSGYNIADDVTCSLSQPSDRQIPGFDPPFSGNGDNGGPLSYGGPATLLPLPGSPLIDAIPLAACQTGAAAGITDDERGYPRPALIWLRHRRGRSAITPTKTHNQHPELRGINTNTNPTARPTPYLPDQHHVAVSPYGFNTGSR